MHTHLTSFLPGRLILETGAAGDYRALARFHYCAGPPATWARVVVCRFLPADLDEPAQPAGVAVLSWPSLNSSARDAALNLSRLGRARRRAWINRHVRVISRVIVHPRFRGLGLASLLVRRICRECPTRYVEAFARMGRFHPLFERGGLPPVDPPDARSPVYYLLDRHAPPRVEKFPLPRVCTGKGKMLLTL